MKKFNEFYHANIAWNKGTMKSTMAYEDYIDEDFVVMVPKQQLDGKQIGGGKTGVHVKAKTVYQAISMVAKRLGVNKLHLKVGKVTKEGVVVKEAVNTITVGPTQINKLTSLSEKKVTVDIDWIGDPKQTKDTEKKYKLKIKVNARQGTADVTGDNKQILNMLTDPDVYGWEKADVLSVYPELK